MSPRTAARGGPGGKRAGIPGTAYPNRTDLSQAPQVAPQAQYGQRQALLQSQQAMALPQNVTPLPTAAAPPSPAQGPPASPPIPGQPGGIPPGVGLLAPTERPSEPVTAGLPTGPGPGPSNPALHWTDPDLIAIRQLYRMHPTEDLRRLIQRWGA